MLYVKEEKLIGLDLLVSEAKKEVIELMLDKPCSKIIDFSKLIAKQKKYEDYLEIPLKEVIDAITSNVVKDYAEDLISVISFKGTPYYISDKNDLLTFEGFLSAEGEKLINILKNNGYDLANPQSFSRIAEKLGYVAIIE